MTHTSMSSIIILLVCINILLYIGGVRVIDDDNNAFMERFINTEKEEQIELQQNFKGTLPTTFEESGGDSAILTFIDAVGAVTSFIVFLVNIVFTPIGLFLGAGLPVEVGLIVGLPLIVLGVIGIASFIRSGA